MARRRQNELDELFELWARWCFAGGVQPDTPPSLLARWMDSKGHMVFGGGGCAPTDTVEERIEAAVLAIAASEPTTAEVLRWEYGVWSQGVGHWRGKDATALKQADKAAALGMSLRTYRRRLAAGRATVEQRLAG